MSITAIIVTWNPRADDTLACAENLLRENQVGTIIYSDNGSGDEIKKLLGDLQAEHPGRIICLWNGENLGIATALNRGVACARGLKADWIMTLDHDSVPEKNMVRKMFAAYENLSAEDQKTTSILCPNFMLAKGACYTDKTPRFLETTITSGQLVKISLLDAIGGYEDDLFIECVDHEFCFRALAHGYRLLLAPDAMLRQRIGNPSIKKLLGKTFIVPHYPAIRYYYQLRNTTVIYKKYYRVVPRWIMRDAPHVLYSLIKVVLYEKQPAQKLSLATIGVFDGLRGKMGKRKD